MNSNCNINAIIANNLCIGCGLCGVVCPEEAISFRWTKSQAWEPVIDSEKCLNCSQCYKVCPNSPECIADYAMSASNEDDMFGLLDSEGCYLSYDLNLNDRKKSASGGVLTLLLKELLSSDEIDGVLTSMPQWTSMGKPHYKMTLIDSVEDLEKARSSHYYPLCYKDAFNKIKDLDGKYILLGVPCVMRGLKKLPNKIREKIKYTFSLACGHNVNGRFLDCLAKQEGIKKDECFTANLRDKLGDIKDINNFNTFFKLSNSEIRRNRFKTGYTKMWTNYFFAHECCLYCPDFFGVDADLSVKDAWGRQEDNSAGASMLVIRNLDLQRELYKLKGQSKLFIEEVAAKDVFLSQIPEIRFKHSLIMDRLPWKNVLKARLEQLSIPAKRKWWSAASRKYFNYRLAIFLSNMFYPFLSKNLVKGIVLLQLVFYKVLGFLINITSKIKRKIIFKRNF